MVGGVERVVVDWVSGDVNEGTRGGPGDCNSDFGTFFESRVSIGQS